MRKTSSGSDRLRRAGVAAIASLAVVMSGCGSESDGATRAPSDAVPDATTATSLTTEGEDTASTDELAAVEACLEQLGVGVEPADESNTALPLDYYASRGIRAMLVFDKGAGWGGTIEAYASTTEADVAETEYLDSSWGYEVGRVDDVVFKTTGPFDDIAQIEGCLTGDPVALTEAAGTGGAAPVETAPDDSAIDPGQGDDGMADARGGIVAMLIDPGLEEQGVIFDRACLETWVQGISDDDAGVLVDNGGDTDDPAVSPESAAHAELVFTCLDLDAIAARYADELAVDVDCVATAFAAVDLDAAVAQAAGDIDPLFSVLATAAEGCE